MTREETIKMLKSKMDGHTDTSYEWAETVRMSIKALEQEPYEDAISRQAVLDIDFRRIILTIAKPAEMIEQKVKALPSVNPQPKTGRWMPIGYDGYADGYPVIDEWECSECGREHTGDDDTLTCYCPNCGCRMED